MGSHFDGGCCTRGQIEQTEERGHQGKLACADQGHLRRSRAASRLPALAVAGPFPLLPPPASAACARRGWVSERSASHSSSTRGRAGVLFGYSCNP